jgi:hypothetical protein
MFFMLGVEMPFSYCNNYEKAIVMSYLRPDVKCSSRGRGTLLAHVSSALSKNNMPVMVEFHMIIKEKRNLKLIIETKILYRG